MLTLFSIPKAFVGHIETIQLNALKSWTLLTPACEIILCGDEPGTEKVAAEFKVRHLPEIARNEFRTPLVSSAFEKVAQIAKYRHICFVNADIILLNDLVRAMQKIPFRHYLMVGRRHNVDLKHRWNFNEPEWCTKLRNLALNDGSVASHFYLDYFLFTPNGFLEKLPPFAVGRPRWDNWFVYHARRAGIPVIDASRAVMAIHQNHDYSHIPRQDDESKEGSEAQWEGPEARRNRELSSRALGSAHQFTILDATHIMTTRFLLPAFFSGYLRKRWHSLPVLYPRTKLIVQAVSQILRPFKWVMNATGHLRF